MKRYYFTVASILVLAIGITSCSNEETKTQNQIAARPSVLLQNGEVQIGTQIWMTKNLNVSRYRNGDPIPQVTGMWQWANLTTGAWCYFCNNPANGPFYGRLYNWYAVNDPRGLAPQGWHIATAEEWLTLQNFLGGQEGVIQSLWNYPSIGNNSSGFTALPAGYRDPLMPNPESPWPDFEGLQSYYANWWTSSSSSPGPVGLCYWLDPFDGSGIYGAGNNEGHYVRCVKD